MTHHAPEEMLLEYVAGTSTDAAGLATACHVALCDACRRARRGAGGGGRRLPRRGRRRAAGTGRARGGPRAHRCAATAARRSRRGPGPLRRSSPSSSFRARCCTASPRRPPSRTGSSWCPACARSICRRAAPRRDLRLIAFKPGVTIPFHDHGGPEQIVVFTGALEEEGKRFERGDIFDPRLGRAPRATRRPGRALHRAGRQRGQAAAAHAARPPAARAVAPLTSRPAEIRPRFRGVS